MLGPAARTAALGVVAPSLHRQAQLVAGDFVGGSFAAAIASCERAHYC